LLRHGKPIAIPPKAFDVLLLLVENAGRLVKKDELFSEVWPDQFVEDGSLTVTISGLRTALGDAARRPHYIVAVPKHGYRFAAKVRVLQKGRADQMARDELPPKGDVGVGAIAVSGRATVGGVSSAGSSGYGSASDRSAAPTTSSVLSERALGKMKNPAEAGTSKHLAPKGSRPRLLEARGHQCLYRLGQFGSHPYAGWCAFGSRCDVLQSVPSQHKQHSLVSRDGA